MIPFPLDDGDRKNIDFSEGARNFRGFSLWVPLTHVSLQKPE